MRTELQHRPVLVGEAVSSLVVGPGGTYVDATFGRGGHSREILSRLSPAGRLFAFDRDPQAVAAAAAIEDRRFTIIHSPFSRMVEELSLRGVSSVSGIFMDIGVSSPQIDDPNRGFSFRADGPLDMRMDNTAGMTAAEWLAAATEKEMARVFRDYGEEHFAVRIAKAIARERTREPIVSTTRLASVIAAAVPRTSRDPGQHPATRSFQAIRIHVNAELMELRRALAAAGCLLEPGGRLAVISFHSLEDRIVKHFLAAGAHPERSLDPRLALRGGDLPEPWWVEVRRIRPSQEECRTNPRARSAVMRVAERTARGWESVAGGGQ